MQIHQLSSEQAQSLLRNILASKRCVPFIGAGFSANEKSAGGTVPSVSDFKNIMIEALVKLDKFSSKSDWLRKQSFFKLADYYWQDTPVEPRDRILKSRFTKVRISNLKKQFLNCGWNNIATLNIDDAIENCTSNYKIIFPHTSLKSSILKSNDLLIKIHGDAFREISENSALPQVIFSLKSYWESSHSNKDVLGLFSTNWRENNILIIGCSLVEEIDLLYNLSVSSDKPYPDTYRIYFTDSAGVANTDFMTALDIDYNITHVLVVDNWDDIYNSCISLFPNDSVIGFDKIKQHKFSEFTALPNSFENVLQHIIQADYIINKIEYFEKYVPEYLIERSIMRDIISSLNKNTFTLIEGRRFSGHSSLLKKIAKYYSSSEVYLFTSGSDISSDITDIILYAKNTYYFFDGRTLTLDIINNLIRNESAIRSNGNKILVVSSTTDMGLGTPLIDSFGDKIAFRLRQELDISETNQFNKTLDLMGITKINPKSTIINSIHNLAKTYDQYRSNIFPSSDAVTYVELQLLLLLFTNEKVSSMESTYLGMSTAEFNQIAVKYAPLVLKEENSVNPTTRGRFELLINCKPWCASIFNSYEQKHDSSECRTLVKDLINQLKGSSFGKSIFLQLIRVDNLRLLFPNRHIDFIDSLFDDLKEHFNDSPDFWLQWAKAILYTSSDLEKLKSSCNYVKKAIADGYMSTKKNAIHTYALIMGKIIDRQNYRITDENIRAVKAFAEAIRNNDINTRYVRNLKESSSIAYKQAVKLIQHINTNPSIEYLAVKNEVAELVSFFKTN